MRKIIRQVVLVLETSIKASRDKLQGILKYERIHGPWRFFMIEGRMGEQLLHGIREWGGTGIIAEAGLTSYRDTIEKAIVKADLPTVLLDPCEQCLDPKHPYSKLSYVRCNGSMVGRSGADHLLERQLQHFAFVDDIHQANWSVARRDAFVERLKEAGFDCHLYGRLTAREKKDWAFEQKKLVTWLHSLPKPIGIMTAMDTRGWQVLNACQAAKIEIPHEVCVLGVDNDELVCNMSQPPLSSIVTNGESGGFLAAEILDGLMNQKIRHQQIGEYGVLRVAHRRSTEAIHAADPLVVRVLEYIWLNNGVGLSVASVTKQFNMSIRHLEIRFKHAMGHTVIEEIQRVRFSRVKTLLLDTDLTISEITRLCGFESESYLGAIFKKHFGKTMSQFRKDKF